MPTDAGLTNPGDLTIERVLEEKKLFDLSLTFERSGISGGGGREWSRPGTLHALSVSICPDPWYIAPANPVVVDTLPSSANLLHVSVESVKRDPDGTLSQVLFASTADRQLHLLDPKRNFTLIRSMDEIHDSPILSCAILPPDVTITTSMSGQVVLYDHSTRRVLDRRRDHRKYVVKVALSQHNGTTWVATAGWDASVFVYRLHGDLASGACSLGEPVASLSLVTNPETITFITHPDSDQALLLITRRDSSSLHYYSLDDIGNSTSAGTKPRLLGSQNLAPHSNAWISLSPSCVAVSPIDPTTLAVATSAVPHMKLIVVRLLIPPIQAPGTTTSNDEPTTQASQTHRKLEIANREDAAIKLHVSTFAPQTPYSTPQVCWRPDGSGVWVNGDDGVLRGLDATTGKICSTLKGGHEPGSKIRSVWAGMVDVDGREEEWVVSGGFDKKLVVWKPDVGGEW